MTAFWKHKTVAAYIALPHHTRYITPVMDKLAEQGADIIYLVGQAERSQEITAIRQGLAYHHVFDFLEEKDYRAIHDNYDGIKAAFAKALLKDRAFSVLVPTVMDKTLYAAAQEFTAFQNFFKRFSPHLCFALHENNRWGKMFSFHAKKNGIPFISLQEGLFTTPAMVFAATGLIQNSTLGLLWGKNSKSYLCDYEAPEDRAIPAGNTSLTDTITALKKNQTREQKRKALDCRDRYVVLLLFSAVLHPVEEFIPFFEAFPGNARKKLIVKFHPITSKTVIDTWTDLIPERLKAVVSFIHDEQSTYDLIAASDLCVLSDTSTTALEAMAIGRPVAFFKLQSPKVLKSDLPGKGVAKEYTPAEFKTLLQGDNAFQAVADRKKIEVYLAEELTDPRAGIETTVNIMANLVTAALSTAPPPIKSNRSRTHQFSIVIPVVTDPRLLLLTLQAVSMHSGRHAYEVVLAGSQNESPGVREVLDSLKGDLIHVQCRDDTPFPGRMNRAAAKASGKVLLFLSPHTAPGPGWLDVLDQCLDRYGPGTLYGGKVVDRLDTIVHAGMLLNENHSPVPAFSRMNRQYPPANNVFPHTLIDRFMAVDAQKFYDLGGFDERSGRYCFMDVCLRWKSKGKKDPAILYVPAIELLELAGRPLAFGYDDAVFFYGRWHGRLWDNQQDFYRKMGISRTQLDAELMASAMGAV